MGQQYSRLNSLADDNDALWVGVWARGLLAAVLAASIVGALVYVTPIEWHYLVAPMASTFVMVFWVFVLVRGTAVDLLFELGLVYPNLHDDPQTRREIESLEMR